MHNDYRRMPGVRRRRDDMKRNRTLALVIVLVFVAAAAYLTAATAQQKDATATPQKPAVASQTAGAGGTIRLTVAEGKEWTHSFKMMVVAKTKNQPQMAFWLEDASGAYVATIYVTYRAAVQDWRASFGEKKEKIKRPSALPVWVRKHAERGVESKKLCAACHGLHKERTKSVEGELAAMTGATPKAGFTREWTLPAGIAPGRYVVKAEINHSKDWNDAYPEKAKEKDANYSGGSMGSGQPSVIYEGVLTIGSGPSSVDLAPVGHGQPAGASGEIAKDLGSLTTALEIVKSIRAEYVPR